MTGDVWFIKRHGAWFRPKAQGYTGNLAFAGHFTQAEAEAYRDHCDGITIRAASDIRPVLEREREALAEQMARLDAVLETIAPAEGRESEKGNGA